MHLLPRDNSPCPSANGTKIGQQQSFNLLCNSRIKGDEMTKMTADSIEQCSTFCATFHPRCEAVTFAGKTCLLKNNTRDDSSPSKFIDGAVALFPKMPASDCANGNRADTKSGTNFQLMCGSIFSGSDLSQVHTQTLGDCMAQCAATSGCAGFSFDATLDQGFMNCYLKKAVPASSNQVLPGIDSGVVNNAAAVVATTAAAATTAVVATPDPVTTTLPASTVVVSQAASTIAAPAGSSSLALLSSGVAASAITSTMVSVETSASRVISVTQLVTVPVTAGVPAAAATAASQQQQAGGDGSGGQSWVAAPVVGGIAAVLVITVLFIMFRRRKSSGVATTTSRSVSGSSSGGGDGLPGWKPPFRLGKAAKSPFRRSWGSYWRGGGGAQRLDDGDEEAGGSQEKGKTPVYEVRAGKTQLKAGGSRPGTSWSRRWEIGTS